jgi:hypothetical protein
VLREAGHRYSSSIYPIAHDHYGMPDAPRFAYRTAEGLLEVPVTTLRLFERNLPSSGGGYFRLLPYASRAGCCAGSTRSSASRRSSTSTPGRSMSASRGCRHRRAQDALPALRQHRAHGQARLRLLADFRWGRMDDIFLAGNAPTAQVALASTA